MTKENMRKQVHPEKDDENGDEDVRELLPEWFRSELSQGGIA